MSNQFLDLFLTIEKRKSSRDRKSYTAKLLKEGEKKIAQKLINHLKLLSKSNNWDGIRWITHSSNENAKKLYDKISNNTGFELYELKGD